MASNKHAQIRYKVLDDCFSNFQRKFYFNDLIERCNEALREVYGEKQSGIKTRTLRDDISYIRELAGKSGVDVAAIDDGNGYYYQYTEPKFSIFKRSLDESDIVQLKETIMMLQRFKGLPNFDWMTELVVKLEDKFNLHSISHSVVGYEENQLYSGLDWFQEIFDAIINKTVLNIQYKTFTDEDFEWTIHPYYLKEYNNRWFLFGLNDDTGSIYNIALDRIEDIKQVNMAFKSTIINFDKYFNDVVGVTVPTENKIAIRLSFSEHRFPYVLTKPLHQSQRIIDIDKRIIEINVIPNNELEAVILSYGKDVEVIEPEGFRKQIQNILLDTCKMYSGVQIDCTMPSDLCNIKQKE